MRSLTTFLLAVIASAMPTAAADSPVHPAVDLSTTELCVPPRRLVVNLMMEGRLAWFSWMNRPELKPKLVVIWTEQGRTHTRTWQHGVEGSDWPQTFFLQRGTEAGNVRWGGHADLGSGREGHKHHFFSKDSPGRVAFVKADLSEIPRDATITRAELVLHIHDKEGLKRSDSENPTGVARFRHVNHEWDWDHVTFTHFAAGQPWITPRAEYPYLGDSDVSPVLWSLERQRDVAARGYHKNGMRDYPLELTAYVARLQRLRQRSTPRRKTTGLEHASLESNNPVCTSRPVHANSAGTKSMQTHHVTELLTLVSHSRYEIGSGKSTE